MKKTYLVLAFLITGFLLAGNAYGEDEVYCCAEIDSNGFSYNKKSESYERSWATPERFKMKFDRASSSMELVIDSLPPEAPIHLRRPKYSCGYLQVQGGSSEIVTCMAGLSHFDFNTENGRFVHFQGGLSIKFHGLPIYASYGKCDKF